MTSYYVRRTGTADNNCDWILEVGSNLITGEADFQKTFGPPTTLESDLLLLSSAIFAADRSCKRGEREDSTRRIELDVPVINAGRLFPLQRNIETILRILSNDTWTIHFRQEAGQVEQSVKVSETNGQTLMFSGGLDSLAAAIDLGTRDESLQLISHVTKNRKTDEGQHILVRTLHDKGFTAPHYQFFVSSKDGGPSNLSHAEEETQRTRSFMFLILGALAARRANHSKVIYLAENGQMAIHLPLTQGRIGSFSTHTAHPEFLARMEIFLANVLEMPISLDNPYVHKTKSEVITPVVKYFPQLIPVSQSCWRNSRLPADINHCGECIPCFIRRIAVEHRLGSDPTPYHTRPWENGVLHLPPDNTGRRNLADLCEFIVRIGQSTADDIMQEWPELFSLNIDAPLVIAMYKRFATEAFEVLDRYEQLGQLLR